MGNYYYVVNVTKKQCFEPEFVKRGNYTEDPQVASALMQLLTGDWVGDEIRMLGDWVDEDSLEGQLLDAAENWPNRYERPKAAAESAGSATTVAVLTTTAPRPTESHMKPVDVLQRMDQASLVAWAEALQTDLEEAAGRAFDLERRVAELTGELEQSALLDQERKS